MKKFYFVILILFSFSFLFSQPEQKWKRFSGTWVIDNSIAVETRGYARLWNYYELLNYNTIISDNELKKLSVFNSRVNVTERIESPAALMISFAVTSESKSWFYHMYAFKLTGDYWNIDKASFIFSDRLDKTKPFNAKNNTFIKEIASADCKVKYGKFYDYKVSFEGENVVLYINGKKILSAPFPEKNHDGRIAISSRNAKIAVDKVTVKRGDTTIFEDDFNEDSIYVRVLKARKVTGGNGNGNGEEDAQ